MNRLFILAVVIFGVAATWASASCASEADCWREIKLQNQGTDELSKLIEYHRQTKTEEARCAMLAKVRETTLQKIRMGNSCAPYVSTAQADIAKARETLRQLDSPKLRCMTAARPRTEEERCHDDLSRSRNAADEAIKTARAWGRDHSDADFCAMIPAAKRAIAAARKAIRSCRRLYPEKMAEERASAEQYEALIDGQRAAYVKRCASGS